MVCRLRTAPTVADPDARASSDKVKGQLNPTSDPTRARRLHQGGRSSNERATFAGMTRRLIVGALGIATLCVAPHALAQQPTTHTVSQHAPTIPVAAEDATKMLLTERRAIHVSHPKVRPAPKPASRVSAPKPARPAPQPHVQKVSSVPTSAIKLFALKVVGGSLSQFTCVDSIFTRESHWNPLARNHSSGAMGIPQRVGAPPGWTDPYVQVTWGIGYMLSRYGSACGAWSFWQGHHWY